MSEKKKEFEQEILKNLEDIRKDTSIICDFLCRTEGQMLTELDEKLKEMTFKFNFYIISAVVLTVVNLVTLFLLSLFFR